MKDQNIKHDKLYETIFKYKEHFQVEEAPIFIMMESTEDYIEELEEAIKTNTPISPDGEGRRKFDIIF